MNDNYKPPRSDWALPIILICIIVCCGAGTVLFMNTTADRPPSTVDEATDIAPLAGISGAEVGRLPSMTPFQPATSTSTPTPKIEVRHTSVSISENQKVVPIIEYIERECPTCPPCVQYVTQIVTVLHTQIPQATSTPEPTPNIKATLDDIYVRSRDQEIRSQERAGMRELIAIFVVGVLVALLLGVIAFGVLRALWLSVVKPVELKDTTQTAEEIVSMSPVDGISHAQFNQIRWMTAQGISNAEIERKVLGYAGGMAYEKVKEVQRYDNQEGAG